MCSPLQCRLLVAVALLVAVSCHVVKADNAEAEVKKAILANYDRTSRPFSPARSSPVVTQMLLLLRSFQISEYQMTATINTWTVMVWVDRRLTWKPSDHGNLYVVQMSSTQLWLPDIVLVNGVSHLDATYMHVPIAVTSQGTVLWVTPSSFRVPCLREMASWPYDVQNCTVVLSSWSQDADSHQVEPASLHDDELVNTQDMVRSDSHWQMVGAEASLMNVTYACCEGPVWHELHMSLHVKRISGLYAICFILPCIALAVHIMAVFWIPPESSAKIKVASIHTGVLVMILLNLFWYMPPVGGHSVPKVVSFASGSLSLSVVSFVAAVISTNLVTCVSEPPAPLVALFSGPAGLVLRLADLTQQMQSTRAPFAEDGVPAQDKEAQKRVRRAEWALVAAGLDRSLCLVQLTVYVLMGLACLT